MDGAVEKVRGSIRIEGPNKATMSSGEVEVDMQQDAWKAQDKHNTETRTSLTAFETIHVPLVTQIPVMVRCNLSGLVHTEPKH